MKKIYLSLFAVLTCVALSAQVAVTFSVDMSAVAPGTDSLHLAGNFNEPDSDWNGASFDPGYNAAYNNWDGSGIAMTDPDMDNIYTVELMLNPARYEFKFVNGGYWENVAGACATVVNGNNNRQILVGATDTAYPLVCFEQCAPCGENAMRFSLDVSTLDLDGDGNFAEPGDDVSPAGFTVYGDFQNPYGTSGDGVLGTHYLQDWNNDNIWEGVFPVGNATSATINALNGNELGNPAEVVVGSCADAGGTRTVEITDANMVLPLYCWNLCEPCVQPSTITFNVDMNAACINLADGVYLMGTATNWGTGTLMSDDDADGIYSLTLYLAPGNYAYKFRVGANSWEGFSGDRSLTVLAETDEVLPNVCFGSSEPCGTVYPPAPITFQARPGAETIPAGQSLWIMTNVTEPQWQSGAIQMTDDDLDGTWTATIPDVCVLMVNYKFVIGESNTNTTTNWLEESGDFSAIGGCGVDNAPYSDNRQLMRTSGDPITVCWDFNTCTSCLIIGIEESTTNGFSVYPVPADDKLTISFDRPLSKGVSVTLVNQLGQVVSSLNAASSKDLKTLVMNTSDIAAGVYSLVIADGTSVQSRTVSIR